MSPVSLSKAEEDVVLNVAARIQRYRDSIKDVRAQDTPRIDEIKYSPKPQPHIRAIPCVGCGTLFIPDPDHPGNLCELCLWKKEKGN